MELKYFSLTLAFIKDTYKTSYSNGYIRFHRSRYVDHSGYVAKVM